MKSSIKLLLATAIATSAPFVSVGEASADGRGGYGPRFGDVDARFLDSGDLELAFEQRNIRRQNIRYSMEADLQATYRCGDGRGRFASGPVVLRDTWKDARSFRASRQGRIHGQFLMPRDRFRGVGACGGGSFTRPMLVQVTIINVRLLDETNSLSHYRERLSCDAYGGREYGGKEYGGKEYGGKEYGGKGEGQYDVGINRGADQYDVDINRDADQYDVDINRDADQYGLGKGESQYGVGKGGGGAFIQKD